MGNRFSAQPQTGGPAHHEGTAFLEFERKYDRTHGDDENRASESNRS